MIKLFTKIPVSLRKSLIVLLIADAIEIVILLAVGFGPYFFMSNYLGLDYILYLMRFSYENMLYNYTLYYFILGNLFVLTLSVLFFNFLNKKLPRKIRILPFGLFIVFIITLSTYTNFLKNRDQEIVMAVAHYSDSYERTADLSISEMNINTCEKISLYDHDSTDRGYDECVRAVAAYKNDINLCNKMDCRPENYMDAEECKEECLSLVARKNNDLSLCEKINDSYMQNGCYENIAVNMQNADICEQIKFDNEVKDYCYKDIAVSIQNADICEKIKLDNKLKDYCYKKVAEAKDNK